MSPPPSPVDLSSRGTSPLLDNTFGALLLSTFIALPLYGLTLAQSVHYARLYSSDRPLLKILVAAILVSDTLHSASSIHICYHYLVSNAFAPASLFVNVWTVDLFPLSMGMTVLLAQGFYTRRIYLGEYPITGTNWKYRLLVYSVVLLLSVEFCFMTASSIVRYDYLVTLPRHKRFIPAQFYAGSFKSSSFEVLRHYTMAKFSVLIAFKWMNTTNFAIATVIDLVLTGAFVTIMRQKRTGFLRTDTALNLLSRYAMFATGLVRCVIVSPTPDKLNTDLTMALGTAASALAIPAFICSLVLYNSFVYIAVASPVSKVYANSVLAVLNCRQSLPHPGNSTDDTEARNVKFSASGTSRSHQIADGGGKTRAPLPRTPQLDVVIDISAARVSRT
ncbi:hypothetical protein V8D89_001660 [Ganoderma adspersum]